MSLLSDLRLDIGDDEGVVYPSGSIPASGVDVENWDSDEAYNLVVDLRLDIGDDELVDYTAISGLNTSSLYSIWNSTNTSATGYFVQPNDALIYIFSNPATVFLPPQPVIGQIFNIKDALGTASSGNITIDPSPYTIDGSGSYIMIFDKQSITTSWNGIEWSIL